jgi:hypothetical protein
MLCLLALDLQAFDPLPVSGVTRLPFYWVRVGIRTMICRALC